MEGEGWNQRKGKQDLNIKKKEKKIKIKNKK